MSGTTGCIYFSICNLPICGICNIDNLVCILRQGQVSLKMEVGGFLKGYPQDELWFKTIVIGMNLIRKYVEKIIFDKKKNSLEIIYFENIYLIKHKTTTPPPPTPPL